MKLPLIALFVAFGSTPALSQAESVPPGTRDEIPISEVILSDGTRRYTIQVKIGTTTIVAGLDSGSSGLRILPNALAASDATTTGDSDRYAYGAGTEFKGKVGTATVAIGKLSGSTTVQLIDSKDCVREEPECPASRIPMEKFGIQGDGIPGEGFRAILGVNMAAAEIASPLSAIGARSWIIELPRPGQQSPGRLILNPTLEETTDFVRLSIISAFARQRGGMHDAVMACLTNERDKTQACGPLLMDTGAPGIRLTNAQLGSKAWPNGTQAAFTFFEGKQARAIEVFTVGLREHASRLTFEREEYLPQTAIFAGLTPYFAFDVLYDSAKEEIGLKARAANADAPMGQTR